MTIQAPVAERPVALPPAIMRSVTCGQPYSAWRWPRPSASASRPPVSRTANIRSDFQGRAGGDTFVSHRQPRKGSSHANLHFQVGNEGRFAGLRGRPHAQQAPAEPWSLDRHRRGRSDNAPPHNFSRAAIEQASDTEGCQLWRMVKKTEAA